MYGNKHIKVDLAALEARIGILESVAVTVLKEKRMKDLELLRMNTDGDKIITETGECAMWSAETAVQVQAEVDQVNRTISELE